MSGVDLASVAGAGAVPADVRAAGKDAEQTYRAALAFERMLVGELTKTMSAGVTGEAGEGENEGQSAATSAYRDMLPGTLADAVIGAGGLGLAHDLYLTLRSAR